VSRPIPRGASDAALVAGVGAIGLVLGSALVWLAQAPNDASSTAAAPTTRAPAAETGSAPSACPPTADPDALRAEVDALATEAAFVEGQLALIGGLASPWPDPAAGAARERTLRPIVAPALDALDGVDGWELDCDEDPCVLVVQVERARAPRDAVREIARDADLSKGILPWALLDPDSAASVQIFAGIPTTPGASTDARTQHRAHAIMARGARATGAP
jgi:hypothetical protein